MRYTPATRPCVGAVWLRPPGGESVQVSGHAIERYAERVLGVGKPQLELLAAGAGEEALARWALQVASAILPPAALGMAAGMGDADYKVPGEGGAAGHVVVLRGGCVATVVVPHVRAYLRFSRGNGQADRRRERRQVKHSLRAYLPTEGEQDE